MPVLHLSRAPADLNTRGLGVHTNLLSLRWRGENKINMSISNECLRQVIENDVVVNFNYMVLYRMEGEDKIMIYRQGETTES